MVKSIITVLTMLAGLMFAGWIVWQGVLATTSGAAVPTFIRDAVTGIGAVLATHFGAVLGMKVANVAKDSGARLRALGSVLRGEDNPTRVQTIAVWLYLAGLVIAVVSWAWVGFDPLAPEMLRMLSTTLLGVIVGALAVSLNIQKAGS